MKLNEHPDPETRWKHRRRMAWAALLGLVAYIPLVAFTGSEQLVTVAWPVMSTLGAIVGGYTGFSTWESIKINATG